MRRLITKILLIVALLPAWAAASVDDLVSQAMEQGLHQRSQWLALLHYRHESLGGAFVSQVDDGAFFLAEQGGTDPAAELEASIEAFVQPVTVGHAQCLFPARWWWLKQQLGIDERYDVACPKFERWIASMSRDSLTLIFPSMYLNNPGSSFGHTFIRFDNHRSALLSDALNYAAAYDPQDGFLPYAWKGITGGYDGLFRLRRYYKTVKEYSVIENRDIWEYRLDYTEQEIEQLLRHVWEVTDVEFDYFFFTENCSYRLLALLDVLREGSDLAARERFPLYAIPVDTIRALDDQGVIVHRQLRPSLATRIDTQVAQLDDETVAAAIDLADGELGLEQLDIADPVPAMDLATDMLEFRGQHGSDTAQGILLERSRIERGRQVFDYNSPAPESGHDSARVAMRLGQLEDVASFSVGIRPSFHDLLDAQTGFVEGAEIDIMSLQLSALEGHGVMLDELVFVNIRSLPSWRRWYRPLSWMVDFRLQRYEAAEFATLNTFTGLRFRAGGGISQNLFKGLQLHALLITEIDADHRLQNNASAKLGAQLGLHLQWPGRAGRLQLELESLEAFAGEDVRKWQAELGYHVHVDKDSALRLMFRFEDFDHAELESWTAGWYWYY